MTQKRTSALRRALERILPPNVPADTMQGIIVGSLAIGALAAARQPDNVNPDRKSSGSQFYIVQGQRQTETQLGEAETIHNNKVRAQIYKEIMKFYADSLQMLQDAGKAQELSDMQIGIIEKVERLGRERGLFMTYPPEVRVTYMEEGGLPHLDTEYTVFGEVYEGLDVIDSIAQVAVRPPHAIEQSAVKVLLFGQAHESVAVPGRGVIQHASHHAHVCLYLEPHALRPRGCRCGQ